MPSLLCARAARPTASAAATSAPLRRTTRPTNNPFTQPGAVAGMAVGDVVTDVGGQGTADGTVTGITSLCVNLDRPLRCVFTRPGEGPMPPEHTPETYGVTVAYDTGKLGLALSQEANQGGLVSRVEDGSFAAQQGVAAGDRIVTVGPVSVEALSSQKCVDALASTVRPFLMVLERASSPSPPPLPSPSPSLSPSNSSPSPSLLALLSSPSPSPSRHLELDSRWRYDSPSS